MVTFYSLDQQKPIQTSSSLLNSPSLNYKKIKSDSFDFKLMMKRCCYYTQKGKFYLSVRSLSHATLTVKAPLQDFKCNVRLEFPRIFVLRWWSNFVSTTRIGMKLTRIVFLLQSNLNMIPSVLLTTLRSLLLKEGSKRENC